MATKTKDETTETRDVVCSAHPGDKKHFVQQHVGTIAEWEAHNPPHGPQLCPVCAAEGSEVPLLLLK